MATPAAVAARLGVSPSTIRNWAKEFGHYLGSSANPGWGRARDFTESDIEILAAIAWAANQGMNYQQIDNFIGTGAYLAENIPVPEPVVETESQALLAVERYKALARALESERNRLLQERDELLAAVRELEQHAGYTRALREQLEEAKAHIVALQARIIELEVALARLQG